MQVILKRLDAVCNPSLIWDLTRFKRVGASSQASKQLAPHPITITQDCATLRGLGPPPPPAHSLSHTHSLDEIRLAGAHTHTLAWHGMAYNMRTFRRCPALR